jgi:hypothetical protein
MKPRDAIAMGLLALCLAPPPAWAQTLIITEWRRAETVLYRAPNGPTERRARNALPPEVDIAATEDPFYRFRDPRTGETWYVLQADVRTNKPQRPAPPVPHTVGACQRSVGMGMGGGC